MYSESPISDGIVDNLLKDLKNNYNVFIENKNTHILKKAISNTLYTQMQIEYYKYYLESHKLLKKLPIESIRILER